MNCSDRRVAYSNSEIAKLMKDKMKENEHTEYDLLDLFIPSFESLNIDTINYMLSGTVYYNLEMLEIASEYLNIPFERLTEVLIDDCNISFRESCDDDIKEFVDIVEYLFSEIIRQAKLN